MRGEVLTFDRATGVGAISGSDGQRYLFTAADVRSGGTPRSGQSADFVSASDGRATEVVLLGGGPASAGPVAGGRFDLGRVISRTFASIRDNALVFLIAAVVLVGLPSLLSVLGQAALMQSEYMGAAFSFVAIGTILYVIGLCMLQGAVVKAAVNGFNGKKTEVGDAFGAGLRVFFPLLGLAIVTALGIFLGFLLLIVPGVILWVLWSVAAPAVVVEKRGVLEALQRSRDLTRGYRWPVFGLMVIYILLNWVVGAAVGGLSLALGGGLMGGGYSLVANLISGPVINVLSGVVASAGVASLYYELRSVKEGAAPEMVASIFD